MGEAAEVAVGLEAAARAAAVRAAAAALDSFRALYPKGPHRMRPLHNNRLVRHRSAWRLPRN